jgi:hypothetical protein
MEVIIDFFATVFTNHCLCFSKQCHVNELNNDRIRCMLESVSEMFPAPKNSSCSVVFSSNQLHDATRTHAQRLIEVYCDYLVSLGLLQEPLATEKIQSGVHNEFTGGNGSQTSLRDRTNLGRRTELGSRDSLGSRGLWSSGDLGSRDRLGSRELRSREDLGSRSLRNRAELGSRDSLGSRSDLEPYAVELHQRRGTVNPSNYYTLWNGNLLNWDYIMKGMTVQDLQTSIKFMQATAELSNSERLEVARLIFWYFRKGIVDNLITMIIAITVADNELQESQDECIAISSGSIRLSSDYDINLYGKGSEIVAIFFEMSFRERFGESPAVAFDSNLYSSSFMDVVVPDRHLEWYRMQPCKGQSFYYLDLDTFRSSGNELKRRTAVQDQHVWSTLKLVISIRETQVTGGDLERHILAGYEAERYIWNSCKDIITLLNRIQSQAHSLVFQSKTRFRHQDIPDYVNHLSVINFKGSETYYTRGAFLDVVLNQQICGGTMILSSDTYLDSFLENLADFYIHHKKEKYRNRSKNAWGQGNLVNRILPMHTEVIERLFEPGESETHLDLQILNSAWILASMQIIQDIDCLQRVKSYVESLVQEPLPSMTSLV